MRQALHESVKALPMCLPNPPVGCLVVHDGEVVGRGYTSAPGRPHAEVMALRGVQARANKLSIYVTLEPCSFYGRTPPCATALIGAGVSRVFVGMIDPDPRNDGRGVAMMREAGIVVHVGTLALEIEAMLGRYLIQRLG
jgi:riboflavin biosynthesis protein RibD